MRTACVAVLIFAAACLSCAAVRGQPPGTTGWQLFFADDFNYGYLDTYKWNYDLPWANYIQDDSYEYPSNVTVGSGGLNIAATRESNGSPPRDFTSGAINTSGLENFTYGYIQASIKTPPTEGTWPAFWMLQNGWPPEMDIMEVPYFIGQPATQTQYWATYHYTNSSGNAASYGSGAYSTGTDLSSGYNRYGLLWEPSYLKFYFNGNLVCTVTDTTAIAQSANMYMLLDLAVGGWPGTPLSTDTFPTSMRVNSVQVWQQPTSDTRTVYTGPGSGNQDWDISANWSNGSPQVGSEEAYFGPLAGATAVRLDWNIGGNGGSRTLGAISFASSVNYTIGWPNKSIMLANTDGTAYINSYTGNGQGTQTIACRLELYNNTIVDNYTTIPITLSGGIIGTGQLSIQDGGTLISGSAAYTGPTVVANNGKLTVSGQINRTSDLWVQTGAASISSSGAVTTSGYSSVGWDAGNSGMLNVSGLLTVDGDFNSGDNGSGTTTVAAGGQIQAMTLYVGKYGSVSGMLTQSGGTVSGLAGGGDWRIGGGGSSSDSAAVGVYNMQAGLLTPLYNFQVGAFGHGTLTQTGGTVHVPGYLSIGRFSGGVGTYNMSSGNGRLVATETPYLIVGEQGTGTLLVGGASMVTANAISLAHNGGTGTLTQSGGTVNAGAEVVFGADNAGGTGTYQLNGGLLLAGSVARVSGTSIFDFSGGTLQATAASTALMTGLTTANVRNGGGTIDNGGFNITIAENLLHSTIAGDNATDGGMTFSGNGVTTIASPANSFNGGTTILGGVLQLGDNGALGSNTGPLLLTSGTLDIHGCRVNVGALSGGGTIDNLSSSGSLTVGNGDVSSTFSGTIENSVDSLALTKTGTGTLFLSSANSYGGGTTVLGGALIVANADSLPVGSSLTVGASGTLIFDPAFAGAPVARTSPASFSVAVPEPGTRVLLGTGVFCVLLYRKRRRGWCMIV